MLMMRSIAAGGQFSVKPVIGGAPADSGFSAGAEIVRKGLAGPIDGRFKGVFSFKKYELMEAAVEIPEIRPWLASKSRVEGVLVFHFRNLGIYDFQ